MVSNLETIENNFLAELASSLSVRRSLKSRRLARYFDA